MYRIPTLPVAEKAVPLLFLKPSTYFSGTTFGQFLYHLKRVNDTNLDYPVILDDEGVICDGWHRVAKAYLEGRPTVKAIRLLEMPDASGKVDSK